MSGPVSGPVSGSEHPVEVVATGFTLVGGDAPVCVDGVCELPVPDAVPDAASGPARTPADAGPTA